MELLREPRSSGNARRGGACAEPGQSGRSFASVFRPNSPFIHLFHLFGVGDEISNAKALFKELGIRSEEAGLPLLRCTPELLRSGAGLRTMREQVARTRQQPGRSGVKSGPRDSLRVLLWHNSLP